MARGSGTEEEVVALPPLWRLLLRHFWLKAFGSTAFIYIFFIAYLHLLRHPAGLVHLLPLTWADRWVAFEPWALPLYLSLWVYVCLPVSLMHQWRRIVGFGWRIALVCGAGLGVFELWPNAVPPQPIDWALYPGVALLKHVDAAGNACPSLHVACAVFAAWWLHWMAPELGAGRRVRALNWAWCIAIAYSTMALKQHLAVDVLAGAGLGSAVAWITRPRAFARSARLRLQNMVSSPEPSHEAS